MTTSFTTALRAIALFVCLASPLGAQANPCALLTDSEIRSALGSAPAPPRVHQSKDRETGATTRECTRQAGELLLHVSVIELATPAAASDAVTEAINVAKADPDVLNLVPVSGLGDRAAASADEDGVIWLVQKGRYVLTVTVAGELSNPPRWRASVKTLAERAVSRLSK